MKLREVLDGAGVDEWIGGDDAEIADLVYDSRRVGPGALFFCVPGERSDGHDHAAAAIAAGAEALVVERALDLGVPQARVTSARGAMAPAAVRFWGDPTAELRVAGITGTNGKTTTAFLLRHVLERAGTRSGLLGTVAQVVGGAEEEVERTTPEAIDLQRTFRRMLEGGDRACAMEVSSHALRLGRVRGCRFEVAAFTNLTQDHLDFHPDMADYFAAKRSLFAGGEESGVEPAPVAVVNVDDEYGARLAQELRQGPGELVRLSSRGAEAELSAAGIEFDAAGARFRCVAPEGRGCGRDCASGPLQRRQRALRDRDRAGSGGLDRGCGNRAKRGAGRPGADGADRRRPGVRGAGRLRPHARLGRGGAARRARAHRGDG